jgi:hypothetical protein
METISIEFEAILRICETVVSSLPLEPRISGVFSCLYSPEEGFEGKINAQGNILQNLRVDGREFRMLLFPERDLTF